MLLTSIPLPQLSMGNSKSEPVVHTLTLVVSTSVPMPVGESGEKEANQQPVPVCKDPPQAHAPLTFLPVGTQHSRAKHNLRLVVMKVEALNRFKGDHLNGCSRVCKGKPEEKQRSQV